MQPTIDFFERLLTEHPGNPYRTGTIAIRAVTRIRLLPEVDRLIEPRVGCDREVGALGEPDERIDQDR